ncbi:hypothetical protein INT45_012592 [Circinella minor]|uniref:Glycoside hydrolase family 28 protein n=1 Tax=Circinella minor TaxID=1195481 RepID=A0A8H7VKH8_9FUNG|nr:hypothetical protein INT45_012592 [Circinella minor]
METWVILNGGKAWALQLDGTIYRTGTEGAIQGNGYEFHADNDNLNGPRILRLTMVDHFSVHDITLTDSPSFHFSVDTCGDHGGLDGIDVWGENIWIHDVIVTNKDERVTIKNPSHNMLIENIYCSWSGDSAFGSLAGGTNISDITYRNVYTTRSNQMMMIKSNGGDGKVSNVLLENFIGHSNAYSLNIDQYWSSMKTTMGDGVQLVNFTITNWRGTCENGAQRGPIKVLCADGAPCTDITIDNFEMWTDNTSTPTAYEKVTATVTIPPKNYPTMAEDIDDSFSFTVPIPIPSIPASFFPDVPPISSLAGSGTATTKKKIVAAVQSVSVDTTTTTIVTTTTTHN